MLKKVEIPTCNTFSGVEYILRGAKKDVPRQLLMPDE